MDDPNAEAHHRHNTMIENSDTIALQKKRARRVSFAETTSIRLFNRDAEFDETPLMETAKIRDDSPGEFGSEQQLEPNMEFGGLDGGNEDGDEDEEMDMRRTFLRPVGSPSPGGSTFGSASSTDEDNFFGPVSANFIKPGRLSHSAASDDNPDLTMDSTAFSMHYRSLARSESGVGLKTPTGGQLFFEEKTPMSANIGSSMMSTLGKKVIPISCISATEVSCSGSHNSNDMSLVEENPYKYDFDKLSPRLDALLAEGLLHVSASDDVIISTSPKPKEAAVLPSIDNGNNLLSTGHLPLETDSLDVLNEGESANCIDSGEANALHGTFPSDSSLGQFSPNSMGDAASNQDNDKPIKSPYQLNKIGPETPLASTPSPVDHQQILTRASPSKPWELASPMPQPSSMLRNGSLGHQETNTSIQKSISKLELLERSAFSSAFSAKSDNSLVKMLDFFTSPNCDHLLGENRHISKINFVEDSATEEKLTSVHPSRERRSSSLDHSRDEILNPNSGKDPLEEQLGLKVSGKLPNELTAKSISGDQINCGVTVSSPSKITWSGNNLMRNLVTSKYFNEDEPMTETESILTEIASGDGEKAVLTPHLSSPHRWLGKKFPASPDPQSTRTNGLYPESRFKQLSDFYNDIDSSPERMFSGANQSNATANSVGVSKGIGELVSSSVDVNSPENLIEIQGTDNGEDNIYKPKEILGTPDNFSTPTKEKKFQILHSKNLGVGNLARTDMSGFEYNLSRADLKGSVSPSDCGNLVEPILQSLVEFSVASPSKKVLYKEQANGMHSPRTTRLEKISASKRNVELLLRDTQHRNEMTLTQRSHKLQKGGNCDQETMLHSDESGALVVHEKKNWTDTYSQFSEDMKNLVSRSTEKLNSKMIDALEDGLVHQQKSKVYEMLHHGFTIQNSVIHHDLKLEKMAETNSLLHQLVFEKAKLQLKHVKKERLLKRSQQLNSRLHELKELGEIIALQPLQKVVVDAVGDRTLSINLHKGLQASHGKLAAMRQALDTLDRNILNLTRIFHACCKIKSEPNYADTIALVKEHLLKKAYCRSTRLEMQMWVIQSVGYVDGQANVILNYLDFIIQRINIIVRLASSVSSSFNLNEANILKSFPNMDACIAFAFVFDAESAHGAKTSPQETQVTSSLLGTLLDVVGEVQLAQMKLPNLTQTSFSSPSVERLHLMLCFFNFTSGRNVNLTLDMSCLKQGIYPSDVVPLQLVDNEKSSSSQPNFDVIKEEVKGVTTGYTRILRLCKCVAQVVRASTV